MDATSSGAAACAVASASLSDERPRGRPFESLRTRKDFDRVFEQGRRRRYGPFSLVLRPHPDHFRVGFKIGRRVGKAVRRNLIRRRFKAALERFHAPGGHGADVVVLVNPGCHQLAYAELHRRLAKALTPLGFVPRVPVCRSDAPSEGGDDAPRRAPAGP